MAVCSRLGEGWITPSDCRPGMDQKWGSFSSWVWALKTYLVNSSLNVQCINICLQRWKLNIEEKVGASQSIYVSVITSAVLLLGNIWVFLFIMGCIEQNKSAMKGLSVFKRKSCKLLLNWCEFLVKSVWMCKLWKFALQCLLDWTHNNKLLKKSNKQSKSLG